MFLQNDTGLWLERRTAKSFVGRPSLFLDRDGVVVEEVHFLKSPTDVRIAPGVAEAIAKANALDVAVVVVTNQSGVARGLLDWSDFAAVQDRLYDLLTEGEATVDLVLACGYHPNGIGALAKEHEWRKPNPGMFLEAGRLLGLDLQNSFIIGDRMTDLDAGRAAGLNAGALVLSGYGAVEWQRHGAEILDRQSVFAVAYSENGATAILNWINSVGSNL